MRYFPIRSTSFRSEKSCWLKWNKPSATTYPEDLSAETDSKEGSKKNDGSRFIFYCKKILYYFKSSLNLDFKRKKKVSSDYSSNGLIWPIHSFIRYIYFGYYHYFYLTKRFYLSSIRCLLVMISKKLSIASIKVSIIKDV